MNNKVNLPDNLRGYWDMISTGGVIHGESIKKILLALSDARGDNKRLREEKEAAILLAQDNKGSICPICELARDPLSKDNE